MSTIRYSSTTKEDTEKHFIQWNIPNLQERLSATNREICSIEAADPSSNVLNFPFQFKIRFLGRITDIFEIYFITPDPVFIQSLSLIVNCGDDIANCKKMNHTAQKNKWQFLAKISKQQITYYGPGILSLTFECEVTNGVKVDRTNDELEPRLIQDLETLLDNGSSFSDVTMKSVEQLEYKVHKAILVSRCAVLNAYFTHDTKECIDNVVESPFESEVLREVLTYIYSDKAPRVDEIPEKLLPAADYYQLSRLKGLCEKALLKKLTPENAIDILQLADLHSANTLTMWTIDFIKGRANLVTKTEGWANLKSVELIKRLYEHLADDYD